MDINEIFDDNGILKQKNNKYQKRFSQVEGANLIYKSLQENKHVIFEGPCGFGKSIAYLIPSVKKLIENDFNGKIVIVTSNISLQDQLLEKDIPFVIDVFKSIYADKKNEISKLLVPKTLKGISNFLCNDKLENKKILYRNKLRNLYNYYESTNNGDLSKIHFDLNKEARNISTIESSQCKSSLCNYNDKCFYKNHKKEAIKAKIIVTNYSMLFTCLSNDGDELDNITTIIFDEAHEAERILREFTCEKINYNTIISIEEKVYEIYNKLLDISISIEVFDTFILKKYARKYFDKIEEKYKINSEEQLQIINSLKDLPDPRNLVIQLNVLLKYLKTINELINSSYDNYKNNENLNTKNDIASSIKYVEINIKICIFMIYESEIILKDKNIVMWIENENDIINLCKKNIDVSQLFKDLCLNQRRNQPFKSCIFTSATLSIGTSFEYLKKQLGLNKLHTDNIMEYIGTSPFDLSKQQLWYVPKDAVGGNNIVFESKIKHQICDIISAVNGGVLSLFTSKKNLNSCKDYLHKNLENYDTLCQYDKSRKRLLESFKSDYNSVLLGCKSFFTGVDVPGQSLRCIIIDKLPFSYFGDPINKKLSQYPNYFREYYLPDMIITLKQAVGRGVRTVDDKCIICILDERLISSYYSRKIFNSFNYNINLTKELCDLTNYLDVNNLYDLNKKFNYILPSSTICLCKTDYEKMSVVELGNSNKKEAIKHIAKYLISSKANNRRLAASAIRKLSKDYLEDCYKYKPLLLINLQTSYPQVRQYTLKALKKMELNLDELEYLQKLYLIEEKYYNLALYEDIFKSRQFKEYS